jgi:putative membrane protein
MPLEISNDIRILIISIVYSVLGVVMLYAGYRIFDALTPTDMQKKIFEEGNVSVGIVAGAFILGLAIVIGAAIHG